MDDVNAGSRTDRGVESLEVAYVLGIDEDVHELAEFTRLVEQVESQSRVFALQRFDDLADVEASGRNAPAVTGAVEESRGNRDGNRRGRVFHHTSFRGDD
jgi:hypothetical protein